MNAKDNLTLEKINQLKAKLYKYFKSNDTTKINNYLSQLDAIENVNMEILKITEIVDCLKQLKKKQDSNYSDKASEIIAKWKSQLVTKNAEKKPKESKDNKKPSENDKSNEHNNSSTSSNNNSSSTKASKKRTSDSSNESKTSSSNEPKKQKLTLSDYKIKKEITSGDYHCKEENEPYIPSENENSLAELRKVRETTTTTNDVNNRLKIKKEEIDVPIMAPPLQPPESKTSSSFSHLVPLPTIALTDIIPVDSLLTSASKSNGKSNFQSASSSASSSKFVNGGGRLSAATAKQMNMSEDEILTNIMSSKHSKRILYTGRKTNENGVFQVPKLLDMCTNVLVHTLDDLPVRIANLNSVSEFPLPFDLIKPVLEKANSKQLQSIEYYSPHFLNDTEYMWKRICEQEFKKLDDLEEDESWREYYFRKYDEREMEFQRARDRVSRLQANKPKERQTQMATVKFVSHVPKSASFAIKPADAANKLKTICATSTKSAGVPVRKIMHDTPTPRTGGSHQNYTNGKRPVANAAPAMSQGMKATLKLIKKTTQRR